MNLKQIITAFIVLTVLTLPAVSLANTYQYVDAGGRLQSVEANSTTQALATAPNIGLHSGVMLVTSTTVIVNTGTYTAPSTNSYTSTDSFYQYIDIHGAVQSMNAVSASVALATAYNISPHSGVMLVTAK